MVCCIGSSCRTSSRFSPNAISITDPPTSRVRVWVTCDLSVSAQVNFLSRSRVPQAICGFSRRAPSNVRRTPKTRHCSTSAARPVSCKSLIPAPYHSGRSQKHPVDYYSHSPARPKSATGIFFRVCHAPHGLLRTVVPPLKLL